MSNKKIGYEFVINAQGEQKLAFKLFLNAKVKTVKEALKAFFKTSYSFTVSEFCKGLKRAGIEIIDEFKEPFFNFNTLTYKYIEVKHKLRYDIPFTKTDRFYLHHIMIDNGVSMLKVPLRVKLDKDDTKKLLHLFDDIHNEICGGDILDFFKQVGVPVKEMPPVDSIIEL